MNTRNKGPRTNFSFTLARIASYRRLFGNLPPHFPILFVTSFVIGYLLQVVTRFLN